jgi:hypothetical protein
LPKDPVVSHSLVALIHHTFTLSLRCFCVTGSSTMRYSPSSVSEGSTPP